MIDVLVVEDERVLADALEMALSEEPDIRVVGQANDGASAIRLAVDASPDVVVMDYRLPDKDGVAATVEIHQRRPGLPVVMLTGDTSDQLLLAALNAGVSGFLMKTEPLVDLVSSVRRAAAGEMTWPGDRLARLLSSDRRRAAVPESGASLTSRERDVLSLMGEGLDNKTIAGRLGLSLTTVRGYVQDVLRKLGAHSKLEAVVIASRTGLMPARRHRL